MTVKIFFVGLTSVELHLRRVAARAKAGGHDIPDKKILERWQNSRLNLIRLLPRLKELVLWDNSAEADFVRDAPKPVLLLHVQDGAITKPMDLAHTPQWAKPIVAAAIGLGRRA
jgi:predicted ABC-type ATPase